MSDEKEPAVEGVEDDPDSDLSMPYQAVLIVAMVGNPTDPEQVELIAKMEALVDAMRKRFPSRVFESKITDCITGTPERSI